MNLSLLLFGVLPLVAFVIIDAFFGLKAGLISAILLALIETLYSIYEFGGLDYISFISLFLVCLFAFFSFKSQSPLFMKLQPVFLGVCFGLIFLIMQALGKPLLIILFGKYENLIPQELQQKLSSPDAILLLSRASLNLGVGFLAHAGAVAYAAIRMNNWWWIFTRGVGLYFMMFFCVFLARF